jgi:multidrug efflux pump subunit AcrB
MEKKGTTPYVAKQLLGTDTRTLKGIVKKNGIMLVDFAQQVEHMGV